MPELTAPIIAHLIGDDACTPPEYFLKILAVVENRNVSYNDPVKNPAIITQNIAFIV